MFILHHHPSLKWNMLPQLTNNLNFPNQTLRNSSNPRQQGTINNGRVTLQPIQGRHTSLAAGTSRTYTPRASGNNSGKQRTVICYNCKGEGHMSKQCTKPKRKRDDSWFKDKVLLISFKNKSTRALRGLHIQSSFRQGNDDEKDPNFVKLDMRTGEKERILYEYLGTLFDLKGVDCDTRKKVTIESKREKAQPH
nr:hypothetical protein [Tanacetum cinerariifolium]